MKHRYPISLLLLSTLIIWHSCSIYRSEYRSIEDDIRKIRIYQFTSQKYERSKLNREYRSFQLTLKKASPTNENLQLEIRSNFLTTQHSIKAQAYLVIDNRKEPLELFHDRSVVYTKQRNKLTNTVNTNVETTTDSNTETKVEKATSQSAPEVKTVTNQDTKTTTTTTTSSDVTTEIIDKKLEVNFANVGALAASLSSAQNIKLRIYSTNDDFWDLKFSKNDMINLRDFLKGK